MTDLLSHSKYLPANNSLDQKQWIWFYKLQTILHTRLND